jgi:hypothetical protein
MSEPRILYFGPPALRKEYEHQVATPAGTPCILCREAVQANDIGTIEHGQVAHYECRLRLAVGSLGHQRRRCACFGGTEEDPPGLSFRQAAVAAALYFQHGIIRERGDGAG